MDEKEFKKHSIQLDKIEVKELSIKKNESESDLLEPSPSIYVGASDYDSTNRIISVGIMAKTDQENSIYHFTVELVGVFCVDENNFNLKLLGNWVENNAPYILHPYLRQHLYTLTLFATGKGLLLPLIEVPTSGEKVASEKK